MKTARLVKAIAERRRNMTLSRVKHDLFKTCFNYAVVGQANAIVGKRELGPGENKVALHRKHHVSESFRWVKKLISSTRN